jgi:hypothetical protein
MPNLLACVAGAFGLAPGGSGLGILPLPLQSGHTASMVIYPVPLSLFLTYIITFSDGWLLGLLQIYSPHHPQNYRQPDGYTGAENSGIKPETLRKEHYQVVGGRV